MIKLAWFRIALLAIAAEFTLSANILAYLGVPYTEEGGSIIAKLHPATYLGIAAMGSRLCGGGRPLQFIGRIVWRECGLALFLICISLCLVSAACMTGVGNLVTLLDTFMPAGIIAVVLCDMSVAQTARLATIVRSLMLFSATVAIGEAASGCHLVPVVSAGPQQATEFRSAGLYDHPLTGAAATMMGLLCARDLVRTPWRRIVYGGWLLMALLAFGGRTALVATIVAGVAMYLAHLRPYVMARALRATHFMSPFLISVAALPLAWVALAAGWATRLQRHIFWDASAQTRIAQFHLLGLMSPTQLIFGCSRTDLLALIEPLRLTYGVDVIENFWLLHFATLGIFGFSAFSVAMTGLMVWLWRRCDAGGRVVLISLILVASTSNSLGRKSPLLVMLVVCLLVRGRTSAVATVAESRHRAIPKLTVAV